MTARSVVERLLIAVCFLAAPWEGVAAQAIADWTPRRCVSDTLAVVQDSTRTTTVDTVSAGITYRCLLDRRGPWVVHIVAVDLRRSRTTFEGARALGAFLGRERVSAMAARLAAAGTPPLVGINADFFDLRTGEITSNHIEGGEWVKGIVVPDSTPVEVDNARTQFAVDDKGRPLIGRFELHGTVVAGPRRHTLIGLNSRPRRHEGLALFNPWYGRRTPNDTSAPATRQAIELVLRRIGRRGDTVLYRPASSAPQSTAGGTEIPADGAVLSAIGESATAFVQELARGRELLEVITRLGAWPVAPHAAVGGWPRILAAGVNVGSQSDSTEGTAARFSAARHPRSAIGISRDSSTILLLVVDGRRPWSVGMSLTELGDALLSLGAYEGMNLDGGGSSTLWVRGTVVNNPSDATGERTVGNALFVVPRKD